MTQVFSDAITDCIGPTIGFTLPSITADFGLPRMNIALFGLVIGGLDFVLDFPGEFPDIDLFLQLYIDSFNLGNINTPEISFGPITFPEITGGIDIDVDITGMFAFIALNINVIFSIFTKFITDFPTIPTISFVIDLFLDIAIDFGITGPAISLYAPCAAAAIIALITG